MKISCVQFNMLLGQAEENFSRAVEQCKKAAKDRPDVLVLPETWNTGFFPAEGLEEMADNCGKKVIEVFGSLAKELDINIVAGSIADKGADGRVFNTSYVFNRKGEVVGSYDKTHLFTPMGEHNSFSFGNRVFNFVLDGVKCGLIICYDIRFPELTRTLALEGMDILFVVSQWPKVRVPQLEVLRRARAIENQCFVVSCNSPGKAGETQYGGTSAIVDPLGEVLARAGEGEEIISANCDLSQLESIRNSINVFRDRRPEVYGTKLNRVN